jgi:hypothetical protein
LAKSMRKPSSDVDKGFKIGDHSQVKQGLPAPHLPAKACRYSCENVIARKSGHVMPAHYFWRCLA